MIFCLQSTTLILAKSKIHSPPPKKKVKVNNNKLNNFIKVTSQKCIFQYTYSLKRSMASITACSSSLLLAPTILKYSITSRLDRMTSSGDRKCVAGICSQFFFFTLFLFNFQPGRNFRVFWKAGRFPSEYLEKNKDDR